jgi:hypothetical protein
MSDLSKWAFSPYGVLTVHGLPRHYARGTKRSHRREPCEFCGRIFTIGVQMRCHTQREHGTK